VETAAFGCPAARAASLPVAPEIQCSDDGLIEQGRHCFHGSASKKSRPSGDAQPKAAVPTQSSDKLTLHLTLTSPSVYNIRVSAPHPQDESEHRHHRHAVYASETTGLLLIALVLLALTLIRYWHEIHWSLR